MEVPVLTYHALSTEKTSNRYTIEEDDFIMHLEYLYVNNYKCILINDYYKSLMNGLSESPRKCVIITFDDGHESDCNVALTILKKYNFKANFFITTDWIGQSGYMSRKQLKTLEEKGMSVQSHAKTHVFLNQMRNDEIMYELEESKKTLEFILEKKVSFISFPGGRYNKNVIDCARSLNYSAMFSSVPCYLKKIDGIYLIGRRMITQSSGSANFEKIVNINRFGRAKVKAGYTAKYLLKKLLGNQIYHCIWKQYTLRQK